MERARTVLEHAEEPLKEAVRKGEISISRAYQITQEKRKLDAVGKAVFNRTNDRVEWAAWSWNRTPAADMVVLRPMPKTGSVLAWFWEGKSAPCRPWL